MFGKRKREKAIAVREQELMPSIFDMALELHQDALVGNFEIQDNTDIGRLRILAKEAKRKGMEGQVKHIAHRIVSTVLQQNKLCLIRDDYTNGMAERILSKIYPSGEIKKIASPGMRGNWHIGYLQNYDQFIPDDIIMKIPKNLVKNSVMYIPATYSDDQYGDPIIAFPIQERKRMYITEKQYTLGPGYLAGVYQWD